MSLTEGSPNQKIKEYLDYYSKIDNPQYAVLINGKWGAGKTYFIKDFIKNIEDNYSINEDEDLIIIKPIYISINGLTSTRDITAKLKEELNPFMYSKGVKFIKKLFFGVIKTATHVNFDINGDAADDGKVTVNIDSLGLLKNDNPKIKGNKTIIFDDLERCNIELTEIFGYINEFVEHNGCKVIIIGDEEKLKKKYNDDVEKVEIGYKEFKEKLIGQTFFLVPDFHSAIRNFIDKNSPYKTLFEENVNLISALFKASEVQNLRILKQAFLDFERFTSQINETVKNKKKYTEYLKHLLSHFLIVYLEYKSGNHEINDSIHYGLTEEQKKNNQKLKEKYGTVLTRENIGNRTLIISYNNIIQYINKGFNDQIELDNSIQDNLFFRSSKVSDWEILWGWQDLLDMEFESRLEKVKDEYYSEKIENIYELIQVAMIFINLRENGIIVCNRAEIVNSFKKQFVKILAKNKDLPLEVPVDHSHGKGFVSMDTEEFKQIIRFAKEKIIDHNGSNKTDFIKTLFESINNDNIFHLEQELDKPVPDRSTSYSLQPILVSVDGKKLGECLIKLNPPQFNVFHSFMRRRYFPEEIYSNGFLEPIHSVDLPTIKSLRSYLNDQLNNLSKLRQHKMLLFIKFLDKLISKLDALNKQNLKK